MEICYKGAIDEYHYYNNADVEHIIIFRDGVGDSQRDKVKSVELKIL